MHIDTTELIDETIAQLRTLQGVFAEDFHLCRRTGLSQDARRCGEALEAISLLLPRLQLARATQDPAGDRFAGGHCPNCD
jgi:hypothetical protein